MEKALFDVHTWNEWQGGWNFARTIEAQSQKQAHYLAVKVYGYSWGNVSITPHKPQEAEAMPLPENALCNGPSAK